MAPHKVRRGGGLGYVERRIVDCISLYTTVHVLNIGCNITTSENNLSQGHHDIH